MEEDTHLCLRCQQLVVGLNNYVNHRSRSCLPSAPPVVQSCWSQDAVHPSEPGDGLVSAPDFFSSLELKSAEPKSVGITYRGQEQDSESDQSDDDQKNRQRSLLSPPGAHTGGKWKPGDQLEDEFYQQRKSERMQDFPDDDLAVTRNYATPGHEPGDEMDTQGNELIEEDLYPPRSHTSGKWKPGTRPELTNEMWLVRSSSPEVEANYTCINEDLFSEPNDCQQDVATTKNELPISPKRLSCSKCDLTFKNQTEYGTHLFSLEHDNSTPKSKQWLNEVLRFQISFIGLLPYQCAICQYYFIDENGIYSHFLNHDHFTEKVLHLLCLNCCQLCSSINELVEHFTSATHQKAQSKRRHPVVITAAKMRTYCIFCSGKCVLAPRITYSSYQKPTLMTDKSSKSTCQNKKLHQSHKCKKLNRPKVHSCKNSPLKILKCDKCLFRTFTKFSLQRHSDVHARERLRPYLCEICGLGLLNKHSLQRHKIRHRVKSHNCSDCHMSFHTLAELANHAGRLHSDLRPHLCHVCGYASKSKQMLRKHYQRLHLSKRFPCAHLGCKFVATFGYELSAHMRIHTKLKAYKCPYCKYETSVQSNLRVHVLNTKKHRGKKVYPCKQCKFSTDDCLEFNLHVDQQHPSCVTSSSEQKHNNGNDCN